MRRCSLAAALVLIAALAHASPDLKHTVRQGDTLARIARQYYGEPKAWPVIAEKNGIKPPYRLVPGRALSIPDYPGKEAAVPAFAWRTEPNSSFAAGEKLNFEVFWQFVSVGYASMAVAGTEAVRGRTAYHIVTTARSTDFFDKFYKVRDVNESWIDTQSLSSLKFASHIRESKTVKDETVEIDQPSGTFFLVEKSTSGVVPAWVQDVLSSLYFVRTREMEVGAEYVVDALSGDKPWPLTVKVVGRETVQVPAGNFDCFVVEPAVRDGAGIFQAKGKLWVWLTADTRKMPVLMRSKIAVGAVEARLVSYENAVPLNEGATREKTDH